MKTQKDLFEHYQLLPSNALEIIKKYADEDMTYESCYEMLIEMEKIGYTFEYGLDAQPIELRKIKNFHLKKFLKERKRKLDNGWYKFIRVVTLRAYFQDMLQTNVVEEFKHTICIRHLDNPTKILDSYEAAFVPQKNTYIMLGVYQSKKYYKIKKIVYGSIGGANVYVKDVVNIENKKYLL